MLTLSGCSTSGSSTDDLRVPFETNAPLAHSLVIDACNLLPEAGQDLSAVNTDEFAAQLREVAVLVAEAAYYDERWRPLADALPNVYVGYKMLIDQESRPADSWNTTFRPALAKVDQECGAAYEINVAYNDRLLSQS